MCFKWLHYHNIWLNQEQKDELKDKIQETQEKERQDEFGEYITKFDVLLGAGWSKRYQKDNFNSKFKECNIINIMPVHQCWHLNQ